jgi:hypothetical protein
MWYFDNILPGEHGSPKPFYFIFSPFYKFAGELFDKCSDQKKNALQDTVNGSDTDMVFNSIFTSSSLVLLSPNTQSVPLRVEEISKVYQKSICCRYNIELVNLL